MATTGRAVLGSMTLGLLGLWTLAACESPLPEYSGPDGGDSDSKVIEEPDAAQAGECARLGAWTSSGPFAGGLGSHPLPSFAVGDYFYVHALSDGDAGRLYSAQANADGSLGAWQQASADHGGGSQGFTALVVGTSAYHFRNGHIARFELTDDGMMEGEVTLLEESMDTSFGGHKFVWDSAVLADLGAKQFVFHLGGWSFASSLHEQDVYRSAVPIGSKFSDTGVDHPADHPGKAAFVRSGDDGYIFTTESNGSRLWRARVSASGELGAWEQLPDLASGSNERGDLFGLESTLVAVRGRDVWAYDVAPDGALGTAIALPDLPADQIDIGDEELLEGNSWGRIGDTIYLTGPTQVFWANVLVAECSN